MNRDQFINKFQSYKDAILDKKISLGSSMVKMRLMPAIDRSRHFLTIPASLDKLKAPKKIDEISHTQPQE